jgi:preprotein translocase subunit SecG
VTWLVTSTVIIVAVVVGLMLLERHRGRPLRF